jgi:hypothetical protein
MVFTVVEKFIGSQPGRSPVAELIPTSLQHGSFTLPLLREFFIQPYHPRAQCCPAVQGSRVLHDGNETRKNGINLSVLTAAAQFWRFEFLA